MVNQIVKDKAAFRMGQTVTCDYYKGETFKVVEKIWNHQGVLFYGLQRIVGAAQRGKVDGDYGVYGLREKYLNAVKVEMSA